MAPLFIRMNKRCWRDWTYIYIYIYIYTTYLLQFCACSKTDCEICDGSPFSFQRRYKDVSVFVLAYFCFFNNGNMWLWDLRGLFFFNALRQLSSVQRVPQPKMMRRTTLLRQHIQITGAQHREKGTHSGTTAHSSKAQGWSKDRMAKFCKHTVCKAKRTPKAQHEMPTLRHNAKQ